MGKDEQAIRDLVATWIAASQAGDTEKVLSLMSDDVVFLIAGRPPMHKAEFAAGQSGLAQFHMQTSSEIQEIKIFGDVAYCWNRLAITITPRSDGAAIKRAGHALSILEKRAGKWVIVRDANMLAVVP